MYLLIHIYTEVTNNIQYRDFPWYFPYTFFVTILTIKYIVLHTSRWTFAFSDSGSGCVTKFSEGAEISGFKCGGGGFGLIY